MWIVRVALDRPYTFVVLALLILLMSPVVNPAYAHRHLPQHQYPCDCRRLAVHRSESRLLLPAASQRFVEPDQGQQFI